MSATAGRPNIHTVTLSEADDATVTSRPRVIVHVSDTHSQLYDGVPSGDILVHSGDFSNRGTDAETAEFNRWWRHQAHPFKVLVCGNHDYGFDGLTVDAIHQRVFAGVSGECHVLQDSEATVDGLRFYGSPWNNSRGQAFGLDEKGRAEKWWRIPAQTDVLVTHMPPYAILDLAWSRKAESDGPCETCSGATHKGYRHWGCPALRAAVEARRVPLHLFGHVHDANGVMALGSTVFSNAAMDIEPRPSVITVVGLASATNATAPALLPPPPPVATEMKTLGNPGVITLAAPEAWAGNRAPVLDIDTHDRSLQSVHLWRQLRGAPAQQSWSLRVVVPPPPPPPQKAEHEVAVSLPPSRSFVGVLESGVVVDGTADSKEQRLLLCSTHSSGRPTVVVLPRDTPVAQELPESVLWRINLVATPPSSAPASMRRHTWATFEAVSTLPRRRLLVGILADDDHGGAGGGQHQEYVLGLVDGDDDQHQRQGTVAVWLLPA